MELCLESVEDEEQVFKSALFILLLTCDSKWPHFHCLNGLTLAGRYSMMTLFMKSIKRVMSCTLLFFLPEF